MMPEPGREQIHGSWLAVVADELSDGPIERGDDHAVREWSAIAADVAACLTDDASRVPMALQRFGTGCARLGWPVEHAVRWVGVLRDLVPAAARRTLDRTASRHALVTGWANEYVRGAVQTRFVDPLTGLVTPVVLARRLRETLQRSEYEGHDVRPTKVPCVVLVDLLMEQSQSLYGAAALCRAAAVVTAEFDAGQTASRLGARIVVLTFDLVAAEARAASITEALSTDPVLIDVPVMAWVEPIPTDSRSVERFVADLYPSDAPVRLAG